MKFKESIEAGGFKVAELSVTTYADDNMAVFAKESDGQQICALSVNLPDYAFLLCPGEFFLKKYAENEHIARDLIEAGVIKDTGSSTSPGHDEIPICRLIKQKLTEEDINQYVQREGNRCPYCQSDEVEGGHIESDADGASQEVSCNFCDHEWVDLHKLFGLNEVGG